MIKVITYGTFDVLHRGHIRLLKRAKKLGDYLIVGITADNFDLSRGKINVTQSLSERLNNVRKLGIADQIIVEEYQGQKIDDIINYNIDIFAIGSDWKGYFDYLNSYCKVIYLERTPGISSTEIRKENPIIINCYGRSGLIKKFINESKFVNGVEINNIYNLDCGENCQEFTEFNTLCNIQEIVANCDAIYVAGDPRNHDDIIEKAIMADKHVLFESPASLDEKKYSVLLTEANKRNLVLCDAIKTAYSIAYNRMLSMIRSGVIGKVVSIDSTCTSLHDYLAAKSEEEFITNPSSFNAWGPTSILPILQILGTEYSNIRIHSIYSNKKKSFDIYTRVSFDYKDSIATAVVGKGIKSEGDLRIVGTKGYIYIPSPWWKTDYFEIRTESSNNIRRFFYQLEGEGIRFEIAHFAKLIKSHIHQIISPEISMRFCEIAGLIKTRNIEIVTPMDVDFPIRDKKFSITA